MSAAASDITISTRLSASVIASIPSAARNFGFGRTNTLRDHLVKGFTFNKARLERRGLAEVEETVRLLGRTLNVHGLIGDEGQALLDLVEHYTRSWRLLLQYDENRLPPEPLSPTSKMARLTLTQANQQIAKFKKPLACQGRSLSLIRCAPRRRPRWHPWRNRADFWRSCALSKCGDQSRASALFRYQRSSFHRRQ